MYNGFDDNEFTRLYSRANYKRKSVYYVIWDNIGLKKEDRNIPAYQIMADVFERLDIHSGTVFNYHQERRQTNGYLEDLELLQYDILYGKQYVYGDGDMPVKKPHMVMGVRDVSVTDVIEHLDGSSSLYGENFTSNSKVFVNGVRQKSTFLNNTRIELPETILNEGDIVSVIQMGSSSTVFRTSNEYVYQGGKLVVQEGTGTDTSKSWQEQEPLEEK